MLLQQALKNKLLKLCDPQLYKVMESKRTSLILQQGVGLVLAQCVTSPQVASDHSCMGGR